MDEPYRVLLVDREWAHHTLVASMIHRRFPEVALYSASSVVQALDRLSNTRFDLVLVEAGLEAGARAPLAQAAGDAAAPVEVFEMAPSGRTTAVPPRVTEVTQLVEQHLKG